MPPVTVSRLRSAVCAAARRRKRIASQAQLPRVGLAARPFESVGVWPTGRRPIPFRTCQVQKSYFFFFSAFFFVPFLAAFLRFATENHLLGVFIAVGECQLRRQCTPGPDHTAHAAVPQDTRVPMTALQRHDAAGVPDDFEIARYGPHLLVEMNVEN